jgi:hypothetical protein
MKDPIISELRKLRDAHAAKFKYDFDAIAQDWMEAETAAKRAGQKFVDLSAKRRRHGCLHPVATRVGAGRRKS